MSLTLIEKINHMNHDIYFYDGIDFDMIRDHKDTSGDFLIFFIKSWSEELIKFRRDKKIHELLTGEKIQFDPDSIDKNTISIYMTSGYTISTYESIKQKILKTNYEPLAWSVRGLV
jgi:hypothetical protein